MKYVNYFFCVSFFSYISLFGMAGSPQSTPGLNLRPLTRTQSCELKNDELTKDAGMIKVIAAKTAGKGSSPRGVQTCSGSPRIEGRTRASSLSKDSTAEYLAVVADASK